MKLITVATQKEGYYNVLVESAKKHGYELITLGMGQKWGGYTMKYKLMIDYLETLKDDNELVIFIDGYDTFVLQDKEILMKRYKTFNKPLVIGCQSNRKKYCKLTAWVIRTFSSGHKNIMNSGSYIGPVGILKDKLNLLDSNFDCSKTSQNDQKLLNKMRLLEPEFFKKNVVIDLDGIIFYNASYYAAAYYAPHLKKIKLFNDICIDKKDGKCLIRDLNIEPVFLSGPGNVDLDSYIEYKGYNVNKKLRANYEKDFWKEFSIELIVYYGIIFLVNLILIILIILVIRWLLKR